MSKITLYFIVNYEWNRCNSSKGRPTVVRVANLPGRQAFCSASTKLPPFKLSIIASRAFPVAGPQLWNSLPEDSILAPSLLTFHKRLKAYLFRQSFPHLVLWLHFYVFLYNVFYSGHSKNCWIEWSTFPLFKIAGAAVLVSVPTSSSTHLFSSTNRTYFPVMVTITPTVKSYR